MAILVRGREEAEDADVRSGSSHEAEADVWERLTIVTCFGMNQRSSQQHWNAAAIAIVNANVRTLPRLHLINEVIKRVWPVLL